ncbi:adenosylcobinamide kinase/adenosylcobinamide phosphate guanyltransferase [Collibacillus ludicampi]|uniref:Adenosylcobinamide kinase n=2 Tax=Collibacillus ludicampi TaxID=2771369 RepID=A0AAV4LI42_9BACL|nr:adenosylcobinamide kinase/adenosylcobinamide phosphate guanyltransferase [Collibacillus ludicampi]
MMTSFYHAHLTLVIGGTRSGKSRFAETLCSRLQEQTGLAVTYLATAPELDEEMKARIHIHRERRPGHWITVEETSRVAETIRSHPNVQGILLIDCLTLLVGNWLYEEQTVGQESSLEERIQKRADDLLAACQEYPHPVVIVSSEVGLGIVPASKEVRDYRDALGLMNQRVARCADAVYAVISGIPIDLKQWEVRL